MFVYVENPKQSTMKELIELVSENIHFAGYKNQLKINRISVYGQ